nr:3-dehydroquinate synthase (DHQS) [Polytomella parva]|eukprot:CAMPEP_0175062740 /NCGR_PEP_ID=MMETSP0052_2-20121109/14342_1 /TAXON_ID=51329 ORGANISM="Polytomella parva, Strain SAG 63-3" /NCGR_SAMPLE_ID=MMETSP0052_2 /ASSEMBLY_ACC=CAM_ASM_000194 /LENGTH=364 /DNA_ID=CAMNT_0016328807 /DNA_START=100 /DNA_END=1194 /DNA_ORIENTATION=+
MKTVTVDLGKRSYPIYIGSGLLNQGELIRKHVPKKTKHLLIVTNETIAPIYLERCKKAFTDGGLQVDEVILPDGEKYKSVEVLNQVWTRALECRLDRGCTFVALGGGVVGDMTGFAAACYQRGVPFIQVPTTVMSQVDSSVGGKTGVNHKLGKNMIGAFHQPQLVLVDTDSLYSLPDRELASGLSEVVKYGLIRDAPFFLWLEANVDRLLARDPTTLAEAIERSCLNKAAVVAADEREGGVRATLNLGHTFGHAIETATGYGNWLHGEAVAVGTRMAADMSYRLGWIDQDLVRRVNNLLDRCRLPAKVPAGMTSEQFSNLMAVDKKVEAGKLRLVLLKGPLGNCVVTGDFEKTKLEETLKAFCA